MKITALLLVAAVAILMMSGTAFAADEFSGGDGSMGNPYQISTPDDFQNMNSSEYFRSHFVLTNDISFADWAGEWEPIGYLADDTEEEYTTFSGTFDGKGYTVSDLIISGEENVGLFGVTRNATFFNLKFENITSSGNRFVGILTGRTAGSDTLFVMNVSVGNSSVDADEYAGVVGGMANGEFVNVHMLNLSVSGGEYAGSLVGADFDRGYEAVFSNCILEDSYIQGSSYYIGGLIGSGYDAEMVNCAVKNSRIAAPYAENVGGLAGDLESADILKCSVEMPGSDLNSGITGNEAVGGFVGHLVFGNIDVSYADCMIEAEGNAGGLIGILEDSVFIIESFTKGQIDSSYTSAGGLIGRINSGTTGI